MTLTLHLRASCGAFVLLAGLAACSSSASPAPSATPRPTAIPLPFPTPPTGKDFTATLVTDIGGVHDRSFNHLAWLGLRHVHRTLAITPKLVQSATGQRYLPELIKAAQHYSTLTVAIGYAMGNAIFQAAQDFPQARFAIVDARPLNPAGQEVQLRNVRNLLFKEQESGYTVGVIAGLMERQHVGRATHNTIGYLGGEDIPAVDRYLAGYIAGARSVDPTVKIVGDFAHSFADPAKGATIGKRQVGEGADILFQVAAQTGTGYLGAAQQSGIYGIGSDVDQSYLGSYILTSAIKKVSVAVRLAVRATEAGKFRGGDVVLGAAQHSTGFAPPSALAPASIVARALAVRKEIAAGRIVPPTSMPAR